MPGCKKDRPALTEALIGASGTRTPEFNCPVLAYIGATTFESGVALGERDETGEEYLSLYLCRKVPSRKLTYANPEQRCLVIGWTPWKLPHYPYVLAHHKLLCWPNSVAREHNPLLRGSLVLSNANGPDHTKVGKADMWCTKPSQQHLVALCDLPRGGGDWLVLCHGLVRRAGICYLHSSQGVPAPIL